MLGVAPAAAWPSLLCLLCLAGCLGGAGGTGADGDPASAPGSDVPATSTPLVGLGAEAPALEAGDWWRWRVEGRGYGAFEMTTVVAAVSRDQVTFAVADAAEAMPAHVFHIPPLGVTALPDLQWLAHGSPMDLLRFPLEDGKTWTGSIEGMPVEYTATATERGGHTVFAVDGRFAGHDDQGPRYVYDPQLRMLSEVHIQYGGDSPFSSATVIDSGTGYVGDVAVQEPHDKFLGGSGGGVGEASVPAAQFQADPAKVWLVFGCYLGGSTGRFEIQYVPPASNEETLACSHVNGGTGFDDQVQVLWRASVPGAWTILFGVVGDGYAEAEVLGVAERMCHVGDGASQAPPC